MECGGEVLLLELKPAPAQKRWSTATWTPAAVPIADARHRDVLRPPVRDRPGSRALFENTDMADQRLKLLQVLSVAIAGLDDLNELMPIVEDLAAVHANYGVRDEHWTRSASR